MAPKSALAVKRGDARPTEKKSSSYVLNAVLAVANVGLLCSTMTLGVLHRDAKNANLARAAANAEVETARRLAGDADSHSEPHGMFANGDGFIRQQSWEVTNHCEGKKPKHSGADPDWYFNDTACMVDGVVAALEQAGGNVTMGYVGGLDAGDREPITTPFFEAGLCPVNVHWHLGAEHLSVGEYDEKGAGPEGDHDHRVLAGDVREGNQCHLYDAEDVKFTKEYDWKYCKDTHVGNTYEVHWPHSAAGACGSVHQYQYPFYDGVFCNDGIISLGPLNTYQKIGVHGQVFTIVNDEAYYYPNLIDGMLVDKENDLGTHVTSYTGSTTGTSRDNAVCSRYTPITWQVDRKCHMISASSFDKMCADMMMQADDMSGDLHPHGARETTADQITANNQFGNRRTQESKYEMSNMRF